MKEAQTSGKICNVDGLKELKLSIYQYYPKRSIDSLQCLSKFQCYFHKTRINNSKTAWNHKRPPVVKTIFAKKNKPGGIILPDTKLYYKAIVIKTVCFDIKKNRPMEHYREPQTNMCIYGQL